MRDDLVEWADAFFLALPDFVKRNTFGCPLYHRGTTMVAFVYEDSLGIKLTPERVQEKIAEDPDSYRPFAPMGSTMRNWLMIARPDARDYDAEQPLIAETLAAASIAKPAKKSPKKVKSSFPAG